CSILRAPPGGSVPMRPPHAAILIAIVQTLCAATAHAAAAAIPPAQPFPTAVYEARREKLMKQLGGGIAGLYARGEEDADGYRQDSDFYYLTGLNEPGAVLVLSPQERVYKEWLFLKPRDTDDERWTGERPSIGDPLRNSTGIDRILRTTALG